MEDFKLILYVLAAVAYFIFMQWRKAFSAPKDDTDVEPRERRPLAPSKPTTSFEDILRELQPKLDQAEARGKEVAGGRTKELARPLGAPVAPVAEARPPLKNYEEQATAIRVLPREKPMEARLTAKLLEERLVKDKLASSSKQVAPPNKYASLLRNPSSVRDAIVLTEIFNRKYN